MKLMPASSAWPTSRSASACCSLPILPQMPVAAAEGHGAQAQLGNEQAGTAEWKVAHGDDSWSDEAAAAAAGAAASQEFNVFAALPLDTGMTVRLHTAEVGRRAKTANTMHAHQWGSRGSLERRSTDGGGFVPHHGPHPGLRERGGARQPGRRQRFRQGRRRQCPGPRPAASFHRPGGGSGRRLRPPAPRGLPHLHPPRPRPHAGQGRRPASA